MNEVLGGLLGKGAGNEADSLSPFVWEVAAIWKGFATGSLLLRSCCSRVLLMRWIWLLIDDNKQKGKEGERKSPDFIHFPLLPSSWQTKAKLHYGMLSLSYGEVALPETGSRFLRGSLCQGQGLAMTLTREPHRPDQQRAEPAFVSIP